MKIVLSGGPAGGLALTIENQTTFVEVVVEGVVCRYVPADATQLKGTIQFVFAGIVNPA